MRPPYWVRCEHEGGPYTDHCSKCAPWWEQYPICSLCKRKLSKSSDRRGYCKKDRVYFDLEENALGAGNWWNPQRSPPCPKCARLSFGWLLARECDFCVSGGSS